MKMHYKGHAWSEEIDPTFNEIIKKYLEVLRLIQIPANKGHLILSLPEDSLKTMKSKGYPKFSKFYASRKRRSAKDGGDYGKRTCPHCVAGSERQHSYFIFETTLL